MSSIRLSRFMFHYPQEMFWFYRTLIRFLQSPPQWQSPSLLWIYDSAVITFDMYWEKHKETLWLQQTSVYLVHLFFGVVGCLAFWGLYLRVPQVWTYRAKSKKRELFWDFTECKIITGLPVAHFIDTTWKALDGWWGLWLPGAWFDMLNLYTYIQQWIYVFHVLS